MADTAAADRERPVLLGLAAEWRAAADGLARRHREALRRPLLALADTGAQLGCWDRARGEIRLSRAFVLAAPWDEVRDLLRHEMAHQLADQAFGGAADTAHGPAFRESCRLLGAHPGASGRFVPLAERLEGGADPVRARAVARVGKLLALAGSRNRHEAELALLRAREFARHHHLDAGGEAEGFVSAFAGSPALRHARDDYLLAALVTRCWDVFGIWVPAWVLGRERMGTVLEVSGAPAQVKLALYAHAFVRRQADAAWAAYGPGRGLGARARVDFACGVVEGFSGTLERGRGAAAARPAALVRTGSDPRLARYLRDRYPRRTAIRRSGGRIDPRVHRDGVRAGERIVLREGLDAPRARGRLLGG
jgi:hypothetical protein